MTVSTRTVVVGSRVGLHARPASLFVQAVGATGHSVTLATEAGERANGASILSVLTLGVGHGEAITLTVDGDNAEAVADELQQLLESDLDANP